MKNQYSFWSTIVLLLVFISSCERDNKRVETYYPSGQIESVKEFFNKTDTTNYYITYFREDSTLICEGEKRNGFRQGPWKFYDEENKIESIQNFCEGLLCDTQKTFYPEGSLAVVRILENEIECFCDTPCEASFQLIAYWQNQNLKEESYLKNCEFHETTILYDSLTGQKTYEISYNHGVKHGTFRRFYENGSIMEGQYLNGEPSGKWVSFKDDSLISEKIYE